MKHYYLLSFWWFTVVIWSMQLSSCQSAFTSLSTSKCIISHQITNPKKTFSCKSPRILLQASIQSKDNNQKSSNTSSSTSFESIRRHRSCFLPFWIVLLRQVGLSLLFATLLLSWEDITMIHPMRQNNNFQQGEQIFSTLNMKMPWQSTVQGLGFGTIQRQTIQNDLEPTATMNIPSYNEVMLHHRTTIVPSFVDMPVNRRDVQFATETIQKSLLYIVETCKVSATQYEWNELLYQIRQPIVRSELQQACSILKNAKGFLSPEAREEIGFDWGSCAWRHCGALADAQEALDELESLVGVLEPYECLFCLDVVERSLRDILAVTQDYQNKNIQIPAYEPLQRESDKENEGYDGPVADEYLEALRIFRMNSSD